MVSKTTDSPVSKTPRGSGAESPTTVRPLDMDNDDDVHDPTSLGAEAGSTAPKTTEEQPPNKPPRPLSAQQEAQNTLKEAFPAIDPAVIKAVLLASGGKVEPAFNALLSMSDPDAAVEPNPPAQPPRPTGPRAGSAPLSQLEADELYARQLAEHYDNSYRPPRTSSRGAQTHRDPNRGQNLKPNELYDEGHSFIDDDLPVIRENLRKGFIDTQTKVNGWISNLMKRIDGEEPEGQPGPSSAGGSAQRAHSGTRRSGDVGRRSGDYNRYDADPQVLSDDFAGIQMHDDSNPPRRPARPLANPDLFKPHPATPPPEGRKVAFQNATAADDGIYHSSPKLAARESSSNTPASSAKPSKWQPLATVDPSPVDGDHDPFSLGDSEDEKETKDRVGGKEVKLEETERLKKAAAEATPAEPARKPEPADTVGSKDALAEELTKK